MTGKSERLLMVSGSSRGYEAPRFVAPEEIQAADSRNRTARVRGITLPPTRRRFEAMKGFYRGGEKSYFGDRSNGYALLMWGGVQGFPLPLSAALFLGGNPAISRYNT